MRVYVQPALWWALLFWLATATTAAAAERDDRAALEAAAQAWTKAFNARDLDALVASGTEDIVLMDPNLPPVDGRQAAREAWRRALSAARGQLTNTTKESKVAGDIGWRIAAFEHRVSSAETLGRGQALEIWKRTGSTWKIHRQMSSSILLHPRPPRPPLPPEPGLDQPQN